MSIKDKFGNVTPWEKLSMSRKAYAAAKPWKKAGMKRSQFESLVVLLSDEMICELKREGDAERMLKKVFGDRAYQ